MTKKKNILIIGAGAVGCSIAYHLAKKGISSTIVERESIGARASGKAWAVITYPPLLVVLENTPGTFYSFPEGDGFSHFQDILWPAYYRMADLASDIHEKCGIDIEYGDRPWTLAAASDTEEQLYKGLLQLLKERGNHAGEWLSADTLKSVFPGIVPTIRGGINLPQGQVEPYKYTLGLAQSAEAMGAEIRTGELVDFKTKSGKITSAVLASGEKIDADIFVIAMGPWSGQAGTWLGREIPVVSAITECLRVRPKKNYPEHSLLLDIEILSRVNGDIIMAGGEADSQAEYFKVKTRPDFDSSLTEALKNETIEKAMELLPDLLHEAELVEHRGDLLAYGPEPFYHKPVMGRLQNLENGYIATRFGALGIQMSLGAGDVMADLIADGAAPPRSKQMLKYLSP